MNTEENRNKRRDKKRTTKMVVHSSARELALIKAARKIASARYMARYLSPSDKAQPYFARQIEEGLKELETELQRQQRISGG